MLELGAGADILRVVGSLYWVLIAVLVLLALWLPQRGWQKAIGVVAVLLVMVGPALKHNQEQMQRVDEHKARYEKAKALFDERCKTAGEKIYRTADGIEGIFLINHRTEPLNYADQYKLDDPYGYAGTGDNYIRMFIRGRPVVPAKTGEQISPLSVVSYKFVELISENGRNYLRYTTPMSKDESERISRNGGGVIPIEGVLATNRLAQYGISWHDISTVEDRENWIAGSSLKIIDLKTNEIMGERIGYMFDRGLGDKSGGRSPWSSARNTACPPLDQKSFYFFDRVIQPSKGEGK